MNTYDTIVSNLLEAYREISKNNTPNWAVHKRRFPDELVKPTIPFVGKHYLEQPKKILVYASAENLADYYSGNIKYCDRYWLDADATAEQRHRKCFDDPLFQDKENPFFPHVHISPMNNGCLATAVYYIILHRNFIM